MMQEQVIETRKPTLKTFGKKLRGKRVQTPVHEDPLAELRTLVQEHKALTKKATAIVNMTKDKTNQTTGAPIPSHVPEDVKAAFLNAADEAKDRASKLESAMTRELKKVPIYDVFLRHVFGLGPVVSAYLVTDIDPRKGERISNWKRFCGLAVIDGRLERPSKGEKNHYNKALRTRLYQMMSAMWKNAAKVSVGAPYGKTSKYLDVWVDMKTRGQHDAKYDSTKNLWGDRKGAKAIIHKRGMWKAAGIFIEDLYVVWRALEGLPVWPSYYAAKLGYEHGGKISVNAPKLLTPSEALAMVGEVGGVARTKQVEVDDMECEDEDE
jgi:hypothetical protein